jgi:hypothetical protein
MFRQYMAIQLVPSDCSMCPPPGSGWERSDVVQAEEAAFENVHPFGILAVHPPGEIQQELVEDALEKDAIGGATDAALDLVDAVGSPGMHRRVGAREIPLERGDLAVGMHVPLAQKQNQLFLGEVGIHERQGNAVEGKVPGGVPGILPLVRHGDDVGVVDVGPFVVASFEPLAGRGRLAGIAI